jgi:CheY-like chemotaxis protein
MCPFVSHGDRRTLVMDLLAARLQLPGKSLLNMARLLVVTPDPDERRALESWLAVPGYEVVVTGDYLAARSELDVHPPDLLVTSLHLGAHNGLQLAIRARFGPSGVPSVVIGDPDPVLEAEAERLHAAFVSRPLHRDAVISTIQETIDRHRPARRTLRKRIVRVDAWVDDMEASLVELSYDGLRLKFPHTDEGPVPDFFVLRVPRFNLECRVRRIWVSRDGEGDSWLWCGAAIATDDASEAVAWRQFVDTVPGWSVAVN